MTCLQIEREGGRGEDNGGEDEIDSAADAIEGVGVDVTVNVGVYAGVDVAVVGV